MVAVASSLGKKSSSVKRSSNELFPTDEEPIKRILSVGTGVSAMIESIPIAD